MKTSTVIDISPPFHVWGNYGSRVMGQNAVSQLNCRILQNLVYQESSEGWNLSLTSRQTLKVSSSWHYHFRCVTNLLFAIS